MNKFSPAPKTALITGAADRIGKAMALDLSKAGFAIAVHYNSSTKAAEEVVSHIKANGGQAVAVRADLTSQSDVESLLPKVNSELGPVGLLINNASAFEVDDIGGDQATFDLHMAVHVRAPTLLARAFHDQLPDDAAGLIVNMIDQRVWRLTPDFHSYTLSKSALWTATKTMAQSYAPRIRVNAIGPGPTLPNERQTQSEFEAEVNAVPLQVSPALDAFAKTVLYFVDMPSITGQMIALDGGQHLAWKTPDVVLAT